MFAAGLQEIKTQDECLTYSGCTVNAKVRLWPRDNNFGKRINCELIATQFAGHGQRLNVV